MARAARRYDIYLPLAFNDGEAVPTMYFDDVECRLSERFGGVTAQQREFPLRGIWHGTTHIYMDQVIIITALDFRRGGSERFIAALKAELLRQFDQLEILITEIALRVH